MSHVGGWGLRYLHGSEHVGVDRPGEHRVNAYSARAEQGAQGLVIENEAAFDTE